MNNIKDFTITGSIVVLRCDFNVPLGSEGRIIDDNRILSSLETIKYITSLSATVVILSHLGRPNGVYNSKFSLEVVRQRLAELLDRDVAIIQNIKKQSSIDFVNNLVRGSVVMLENLRFHQEEEIGDDNFAQILANYGSIYVNDAFACSHRNHTSITNITKYLPSFAGFNLLNEVKAISSALNKNENSMCIIGGSKISSKVKLIKNMMRFYKNIFIGGAMANTFFVAQGKNIGMSLIEKEYISTAVEILDLAKTNGINISLPIDVITSKSSKIANNCTCIDVKNVQNNDFILDAGPQTLKLIEKKILTSKFVIWNGPLGMYEISPFATSSIMLANIISYHTRYTNIKSIVGGGDAVACVNMAGMANNFTFISTGGGAFLEYLENNTLPGIEVLKKEIEN